MRRLNRAGFTLVELLTALSLTGIITLAAYRVLDSQRRVYHDHLARVELNRNLRMAAALIPAVIRQLDATDPNGGDIVSMNGSSVTYRSFRNVHFLCRPAQGLPQITVAADSRLGPDALDVLRQALLLFVENDSASADDDRWLPVDAVGQAPGPACPGESPGVTISLAGVFAGQLDSVATGAPILGFLVERLAAYRDGSGDWWLGLQQQQKATGQWTDIQPVTGPLAPAGLLFTYLAADGSVTGRTDEVARIGVTVRARSERPLWGFPGGVRQYRTASLTTQVALRNNRRW